MTGLLIHDMTEEGEQHVGRAPMCACTRRRLPCLKETKNACVACPTVER